MVGEKVVLTNGGIIGYNELYFIRSKESYVELWQRENGIIKNNTCDKWWRVSKVVPPNEDNIVIIGGSKCTFMMPKSTTENTPDVQIVYHVFYKSEVGKKTGQSNYYYYYKSESDKQIMLEDQTKRKWSNIKKMQPACFDIYLHATSFPKKAEIAGIYDITTKSKSTHTAPKSKWITPANKVCRANGGKLEKGICSANLSDAKAICRASGGRLPTKQELIEVIDECGGNTANTGSAHTQNEEDPNYQACHKSKGFGSSDFYWSSTTYAGGGNLAWVVCFNDGSVYNFYKYGSSYVRCVRAGQ